MFDGISLSFAYVFSFFISVSCCFLSFHETWLRSVSMSKYSVAGATFSGYFFHLARQSVSMHRNCPAGAHSRGYFFHSARQSVSMQQSCLAGAHSRGYFLHLARQSVSMHRNCLAGAHFQEQPSREAPGLYLYEFLAKGKPVTDSPFYIHNT